MLILPKRKGRVAAFRVAASVLGLASLLVGKICVVAQPPQTLSNITSDNKYINGNRPVGYGAGLYKFDNQDSPLGLFPLNRSQAVAEGWITYVATRANENETETFYVHQQRPTYRLVFGGDDGQEIRNSDPLTKIVVRSHPMLDMFTGMPLEVPGSFLVGPDDSPIRQQSLTTRSNTVPRAETNMMMEHHIRLLPDGNVTVGNLTIPPTWRAAEAEGWLEASCVETMGGSHYLPPPGFVSSGENAWKRYMIVPLYDKYTPGSRGALTSIGMTAGTNATNVTDIIVSDRDRRGEDPFTYQYLCLGTFCGDSDCARSPFDGEFLYTVHLYLDSDIGLDMKTGMVANRQCQGGGYLQCHETPCLSCCGNGLSRDHDILSLENDDDLLALFGGTGLIQPEVSIADLGHQCLPPPVPAVDAEIMALCNAAFASLHFDPEDYYRYDTFFDDESTLTLAQAGIYRGPEGIEEYVRFAHESSPYVENHDILYSQTFLKSFDRENDRCKFMAHRVHRYEMDPSTVRESTFLAGTLLQIEYDFVQNYIPSMDVFYTEEFLLFMFGVVFNTEKTRDFICSVSEKSCPDTNMDMSHQECLDELERLPIASGNASAISVTGRDFGCRALHAVFAQLNSNHCPHISFEPQEDSEGKVKCQKASPLSPSDLFDKEDLEAFLEFLESKESIIESSTGIEILSLPKESNTIQLILVGFIVPIVVSLLVYFGFRDRPSESSDCDCKDSAVDKLQAKRNHRLSLVLMSMPGILLVANGLAGIAVWLVQRNHPEWGDQDDDDQGFPLQDSYFGKPLAVGESDPQERMSDAQFQVYLGLIVWITCLLSGIGLECFVWIHFLQTWCAVREGLWRFAQFVFPMMLVSSFGLASHQNYWALPIFVTGLYKFGFPETIMYLYHGLFSRANKLARAADLINGIGILIHHGAAGLVICMTVVGVISPTRYALNCILILVMQHWFVLLSYWNRSAYAAVEVFLEYYFEWIIFSNFAEIYNLHWVAAVAAGVMIFAHWLFLLGALVEAAVVDRSEGGDNDDGNVITRGNQVIDQSSPSFQLEGSPTATAERQLSSVNMLNQRKPIPANENRPSFVRVFHGKTRPSVSSVADELMEFIAQEELAALMEDDERPSSDELIQLTG